MDNKLRKAVGILYSMDAFVLSEMDNMYWLSMGVPDGEFDEVDRHSAEVNFADHDWLIVDDQDNFDEEAFSELLDAFESATDDFDDYDQAEREALIKEAKEILSTNESYDKDGNHEKCEECGNLLNDAGECPKCVHGEEDLTEATLNEGPFDKIRSAINARKDVEAAANAADARDLKQQKKLTNNLEKILAPSYSDKTLQYLIDGEWVDYKTFTQKYPANTVSQQAKSTDLHKQSIDTYKELAGAINTVVRNDDGWIIRRGLEVIKPKTVAFNNLRPDLLEIKDGYRAEDIIGTMITKTQETAKPESPETDTQAEKSAESSDKSEENSETPSTTQSNGKLPSWVTNESIKAAITLLAKRKNGSAAYFDKNGKLIDYRNINVDNVLNVFTDREGKNSFMNALENVKAGLAKRKQAAIKSAAMFGESYDDSMEYTYTDVELDEGLSTDEFNELMQLAKEIGIKTVGELNDFKERENVNDDALLDYMRQYRDDLGDDFEIIEESVNAVEILEEDFTTTDELISGVLNNEKRDLIKRQFRAASRYFNVDEKDLIIYSDHDFEYNPVYFADESKEIIPGLTRYDVATIQVLSGKINGLYVLYFKNREEADNYLTFAQSENI